MSTWHDEINDEINKSITRIHEQLERIAKHEDEFRGGSSVTPLSEILKTVSKDTFMNPKFNHVIRLGFNGILNSDDFRDASEYMSIIESFAGCSHFIGAALGYNIQDGRYSDDTLRYVPGRKKANQPPMNPMGTIACIAEYLQLINEVENAPNTYQSVILQDKLSLILMGVFDVLYIILGGDRYSVYITGINDAIKKDFK